MLDAQVALERWYEGDLDGVFGPQTAGAARAAKWDLGFPAKQCTQTYGPVLDGILTGAIKPGPLYRLRARRRAAVETRWDKLYVLAVTQLGVRELPAGSNRVVYSAWYGMVGPWCAMFISWLVARAGIGTPFRYAYCPFIVADARAGRGGLRVVGGPGLGVLALYDWRDDGVSDHVGLTVPEETLRRLVPTTLALAQRRSGTLRSGDFWAFEGNTSASSDSNGGQVMLRRRSRADVQAFVQLPG